jgi:hypothetical protein
MKCQKKLRKEFIIIFLRYCRKKQLNWNRRNTMKKKNNYSQKVTAHKIVVTSPNISEETLKEMKLFFLKTSIPRILAQLKK